MTAQDRRCPHCGNVVPVEQGQHAENLVRDLVRCPHCGEQVTLEPDAVEQPASPRATATAAPPGRREDETFSGQDTMPDLAEELRDKPT